MTNLKPKCPCYACEKARNDHEWSQGRVPIARFIVCEFCGNKRCPHASHHDQKCTGSNEPGQSGSRF